MKKLFIASLFISLLFTGCSKPADKQINILDEIVPELDNAQKQDVTTEENLKANVGLTFDDVKDPVLYLGAVNQNTTFFFMATLQEDSDQQKISDQLTQVMEGWVNTANQGYISGNTEYSLIIHEDKIYGIMHQDASTYQKIIEIIQES